MSLSTIMGYTYRTEVELGTGGSGVVYKAWHKRLRKHVVIKEHIHDQINDIETRRNEVEALKSVKSTFLPQVFDFMTEGDRSFTVIEYVEGESLDKILQQNKKFTKQQALKWYEQLALALEALHRQDICHRDIKPANIMLTPGGDVCLIDFNSALVKGNDSRLISRSKGYASPEQYEIYKQLENYTAAQPVREGGAAIAAALAETDRGAAENTGAGEDMDDNKTELTIDAAPVIDYALRRINWKRSDVYSLGATMYHIITGKRPPKQAPETEIMQELDSHGGNLAEIVKKSMRFDPSERFANATELVAVIQNIQSQNAHEPEPTKTKVNREIKQETVRSARQYQILGIVSIIVLVMLLKRRRR